MKSCADTQLFSSMDQVNAEQVSLSSPKSIFLSIFLYPKSIDIGAPQIHKFFM